MKTGRNSLCNCGSGLKYKNCCGPKEGAGKRPIVIMIGAVLICSAVVLAFFARNSNQLPSDGIPAGSGAPAAQPAPGAAQTGTPGAPQPPGPAPEGKVWSVEHGHWHDASAPGQGAPAGTLTAPGSTAQGAAQPAAQPGSPQPPGPAPAGKVWSVEHGHWHDAK
jgi:hypothetical protein